MLGPALYLLYTSDIPTTPKTVICTFADDTSVLSVDESPKLASLYLQRYVDAIVDWASIWHLKLSHAKSENAIFTLRQGDCDPIKIGNYVLPQVDHVRSLGLHLDRRLTWKRHIEAKLEHIKLRMHELGVLWNTSLSRDLRLLKIRTILTPILTYSIELWGGCCNSLFTRVEGRYNKLIRRAVGAPWYIRNNIIMRDTGMPPFRQLAEERRASYMAGLRNHSNQLAQELSNDRGYKRLKRRGFP